MVRAKADGPFPLTATIPWGGQEVARVTVPRSFGQATTRKKSSSSMLSARATILTLWHRANSLTQK